MAFASKSRDGQMKKHIFQALWQRQTVRNSTVDDILLFPAPMKLDAGLTAGHRPDPEQSRRSRGQVEEQSIMLAACGFDADFWHRRDLQNFTILRDLVRPNLE